LALLSAIRAGKVLRKVTEIASPRYSRPSPLLDVLSKRLSTIRLALTSDGNNDDGGDENDRAKHASDSGDDTWE
jgi:hypothetical protein